MKLTGLNMSEREKTTLLAGLFLVLLVAFYFYMYQPTNVEMLRLENELAGVQDKLSQLRLIAENPGDFDQQMNASLEQIEAVEEKLPTGGNSQELIRMLEDRAIAVNATIVSLKPGQVADKGEYLAYPYTIELTGNYFDIIRYCEGLEQLPRVINLNGWKIQKNDRGVMTASFAFEAYGGKGNKPIADKEVTVSEQGRNPFI